MSASEPGEDGEEPVEFAVAKHFHKVVVLSQIEPIFVWTTSEDGRPEGLCIIEFVVCLFFNCLKS